MTLHLKLLVDNAYKNIAGLCAYFLRARAPRHFLLECVLEHFKGMKTRGHKGSHLRCLRKVSGLTLTWFLSFFEGGFIHHL